jgi:hypothetical protein
MVMIYLCGEPFVDGSTMDVLRQEDLVGLCDMPAQGLIGLIRILIPTSYNLFSGSPSRKNSEVKRA